MLHKKKNKKQVYFNACTRKDQDYSSKAFFYSSTMAEKTQLKVTIEESSSWSKARAQESKRAKEKDQREMRAKSP